MAKHCYAYFYMLTLDTGLQNTSAHSHCATPSLRQMDNTSLLLLMLSWPHTLFLYWAWPINIFGLEECFFCKSSALKEAKGRQTKVADGQTLGRGGVVAVAITGFLI